MFSSGHHYRSHSTSNCVWTARPSVLPCARRYAARIRNQNRPKCNNNKNTKIRPDHTHTHTKCGSTFAAEKKSTFLLVASVLRTHGCLVPKEFPQKLTSFSCSHAPALKKKKTYQKLCICCLFSFFRNASSTALKRSVLRRFQKIQQVISNKVSTRPSECELRWSERISYCKLCRYVQTLS